MEGNLAVERLIKLANINSHSSNLDGIGKCFDLLVEWFDFPEINITKTETYLKIKRKSSNPKAIRVLLMGHIDTVYSTNSSFQTCRFLDPQTLNGPGVADLKGGIMVILEALQILESNNHKTNINWEVFINSDEEIGSPESKKLFEDLASTHDLGLIFEPSLEDGSIAYRRKGSGTYRISAYGKEAHVGRNFWDGANAITAIAEFINEAKSLTQKHIINFGKIEGGGALNVVSKEAHLDINIRVDDKSESEFIIQEFNRITDEISSKDSRISFRISGALNRSPKIPGEKIAKIAEYLKICGQELGQELKFKDTGGCCDGNNLAELGLPNLDSLGVIGGRIHSEDEFMFIPSIKSRGDLVGLLLCKLASGKLQW